MEDNTLMKTSQSLRRRDVAARNFRSSKKVFVDSGNPFKRKMCKTFSKDDTIPENMAVKCRNCKILKYCYCFVKVPNYASISISSKK